MAILAADEVSMKMIALNEGIRVGGPFDGSEYCVLIYPGDYPNDQPPPHVTDINRVFSSEFPEGAIYRWVADKKEWHYVGPFEQEGQERNRRFFGFFGVEPAPPL